MPGTLTALPPLVPRRGNRFSRWLGRVLLRLLRWRFVGEFPNLPKMVLIVAPHSSNRDFFVGVAVMFALGFEARFIAKRELFRGPVGAVMRWLGGIPVDRRSPHGLVAQLKDTLDRHERIILAITPEGTRKPVREWKTGFYHIAHAAALPIAPAYFDNVSRTVGFFPVVTPTGDAEREIAALRGRYAGLPRRDQL
jgi:1-acyl-sn-glycerol-3-phosphate acyltransferase